MSAVCPFVRAYDDFFLFFFFNDPATTEIYTLSLHDALPICSCPTSTSPAKCAGAADTTARRSTCAIGARTDRKSTRLNSSHVAISYAVFCLKKKKNTYFVFFFLKKKKN